MLLAGVVVGEQLALVMETFFHARHGIVRLLMVNYRRR